MILRSEEFDFSHPDYAEVLHDLGSLYEIQKKYEEAENMYRKSLKIKESKLGRTHPSYLRNMEDLTQLSQVK